MAPVQRVKKPTTRKGKKALIAKESKIIEGPKLCVLLQGRKSSELTRGVLLDIYNLKKPDTVQLTRKNDITPFEDATLLEKFSQRKETPLFVVGSHSKKRPHNIILGRTYDYHLLDMIELGADNFKALKDFETGKICPGIKPCLTFNGPAWEQSEDLRRLKSLLIDFFNREIVDTIRLQGLEHVISFTATDESKIFMRSYKITFKKSGQKTPRIELEEIGPSIDFSLRRTKLASIDLMKEACKKPKELKKSIDKKNISIDKFGTKHGRVHMVKQDVNKLQTRKMKGLKKTPEEKKQMRITKKQLAKGANPVVNPARNRLGKGKKPMAGPLRKRLAKGAKSMVDLAGNRFGKGKKAMAGPSRKRLAKGEKSMAGPPKKRLAKGEKSMAGPPKKRFKK